VAEYVLQQRRCVKNRGEHAPITAFDEHRRAIDEPETALDELKRTCKHRFPGLRRFHHRRPLVPQGPVVEPNGFLIAEKRVYISNTVANREAEVTDKRGRVRQFLEYCVHLGPPEIAVPHHQVALQSGAQHQCTAHFVADMRADARREGKHRNALPRRPVASLELHDMLGNGKGDAEHQQPDKRVGAAAEPVCQPKRRRLGNGLFDLHGNQRALPPPHPATCARRLSRYDTPSSGRRFTTQTGPADVRVRCAACFSQVRPHIGISLAPCRASGLNCLNAHTGYPPGFLLQHDVPWQPESLIQLIRIGDRRAPMRGFRDAARSCC